MKNLLAMAAIGALSIQAPSLLLKSPVSAQINPNEKPPNYPLACGNRRMCQGWVWIRNPNDREDTSPFYRDSNLIYPMGCENGFCHYYTAMYGINEIRSVDCRKWRRRYGWNGDWRPLVPNSMGQRNAIYLCSNEGAKR